MNSKRETVGLKEEIYKEIAGCCISDESASVATEKVVRLLKKRVLEQFEKKLLENQQPLSGEIVQMVNKYFWELI